VPGSSPKRHSSSSRLEGGGARVSAGAGHHTEGKRVHRDIALRVQGRLHASATPGRQLTACCVWLCLHQLVCFTAGEAALCVCMSHDDNLRCVLSALHVAHKHRRELNYRWWSQGMQHLFTPWLSGLRPDILTGCFIVAATSAQFGDAWMPHVSLSCVQMHDSSTKPTALQRSREQGRTVAPHILTDCCCCCHLPAHRGQGVCGTHVRLSAPASAGCQPCFRVGNRECIHRQGQTILDI
jgi:hypothetical protein